MSLKNEKNCYYKFFGHSGLSAFWSTEQNQMFLTLIIFYKCYVLERPFGNGIRTCSGWGIQGWMKREMIKKRLLGKSVSQDSDAMNTNQQFFRPNIFSN